IAMGALGRVQKDGRSPRRGERRGDLPADEPGLADAGNDDAARRVRDQRDRTGERFAQPILDRGQRLALEPHDTSAARDDLFRGHDAPAPEVSERSRTYAPVTSSHSPR